eukprot:m.121870 g.121870  ORF g.121870 m.121870 type:complete len:51 (-) comp9384_c1_seq1:3002-3154(-)
MCFPLNCSSCGKTSFGGCGSHLTYIYSGLPKEEICTCNPKNVAYIKRNLS